MFAKMILKGESFLVISQLMAASERLIYKF
jgi:hypothetical protein